MPRVAGMLIRVLLAVAALAVAAIAAVMSLILVGFSPLDDEPIPWGLVSVLIIISVAAVLCGALAARAAAARLGRR